jgi:beta-lactamase superfamily II metal-dependent hydrolase
VGQGDATLVRSPDGKAALIDAGPDSRIVSQLVRLGIESLDLLVATHAHADHIGGMEAVLGGFRYVISWNNGVPHTTHTYRSLMREVVRSDVAYLEPVSRTIELGAVRFSVLPPPSGESQSDLSVGLIVTYGEFRALLPGDSEIEELQHFLSLGVPKVTVLKAAHHGSRDGVTPAWLMATQPHVVIISCGKNNPYGPHPWALRYYEAKAEEVDRTDRDGKISVRAAAHGGFTVTTSASDRARTDHAR